MLKDRKRAGRVCIPLRIGTKDVLLEKWYDVDDQLEGFSKTVIPAKLSVLSLQLQHMGRGADEIEMLFGTLLSIEGFSLQTLSGFLDAASMRVGNMHDPIAVIQGVALHVARTSERPIVAAALIFEHISGLGGEDEKDLLMTLKGN
ncbi:MAG: hypothetical protein U0R44_02620 [Candidatus Micrarchaeia archaeon]